MLHVWPHLKDNDCPPTIWMIYQQNQFYKIQWLKKDLLVPNANHDFTREKHMWIISALLVKWSALANSFTLECFTKFFAQDIFNQFYLSSSSMGFRDTFCKGFTWDTIQNEFHIGFYFGTWFKLDVTWDYLGLYLGPGSKRTLLEIQLYKWTLL